MEVKLRTLVSRGLEILSRKNSGTHQHLAMLVCKGKLVKWAINTNLAHAEYSLLAGLSRQFEKQGRWKEVT